MWMYWGPSCLDRPFSTELGDTEINTQIQGIHAHGADLNLGSGSIPLREGVDSPRVSSLGFLFVYLCQFLFLTIHMFLRRVLGVLTVPYGGSPYLRMWQDGRPIMSIANECRHGGRGDGTGASPRRRQGRDGGNSHLSQNSQEETMKRRMKMERREE
jgi:hypothetical protein